MLTIAGKGYKSRNTGKMINMVLTMRINFRTPLLITLMRRDASKQSTAPCVLCDIK